METVPVFIDAESSKQEMGRDKKESDMEVPEEYERPIALETKQDFTCKCPERNSAPCGDINCARNHAKQPRKTPLAAGRHSKDSRRTFQSEGNKFHHSDDKKMDAESDRRSIVVTSLPPQSLSQALSQSIAHRAVLGSNDTAIKRSHPCYSPNVATSPQSMYPPYSHFLPSLPHPVVTHTSKTFHPRVIQNFHTSPTLLAENLSIKSTQLDQQDATSPIRNTLLSSDSQQHHRTQHTDGCGLSKERLNIPPVPPLLSQTVQKPSFLISDILSDRGPAARSSKSCFVPVRNSHLHSLRPVSPELDVSSVSDGGLSRCHSPLELNRSSDAELEEGTNSL